MTYQVGPRAGTRVKKTTSWQWVEPEWRVLQSTSPDSSAGGGAAAPPPPPLAWPAPQDESALDTTEAPASPSIDVQAPEDEVLTPEALALVLASQQRTRVRAAGGTGAPYETDADGWQYGDNHFEKLGPRGGLGRYTRRRAWVRTARLVEQTEVVPAPGAISAALEAATSPTGRDKERSASAGGAGRARSPSAGAGSDSVVTAVGSVSVASATASIRDAAGELRRRLSSNASQPS